jgi:hypothetical protein
MTNGWLRAGLIATLAGWSACAFDADYHRTRYQCDDGACPSGYACRRGFCEPESQGAPPSGLEECGTTDLAVNDFEDQMVGGATWRPTQSNTMSFTYVEGRLQATYKDPAVAALGGYETRQLYLLRDSAVHVEVPDYDPASKAVLTLEVDVDTSTDLTFELKDGALSSTYDLFDSRHVTRKVGYDPVAHRYWQIREAEGTIYWEVSGDGGTWEPFSTASSLPFAGLVRIRLLANMPRDGVIEPVLFDNVNVHTLAGGESWCPTASLTDDFNDGLVGSAWQAVIRNNCRFFEKNGALFFDYPAEGMGDCRYESRTYYDLTGSSIAVEVPQVDETGTIRTIFRLSFPDGTVISFVHGNEQMNRLLCQSTLMGAEATPCTLNYDPDEHRWWRFRHDEDTARLHWETSPDGKSWISQGQYDVSDVTLPGAVVHLASDSFIETGRTDVATHFDNLNTGAD